MSRVGILSSLHDAVGNLVTYICLRQSFVAISFERCRHFLAHVACRNLPWQGLYDVVLRYANFVQNACIATQTPHELNFDQPFLYNILEL